MFNENAITLSDIQSIPTPGNEYIKDNEAYMTTYSEYSPNAQILIQIRELLVSKKEKLIIRAFGAGWCGDCRIQIPRLIKIQDILANDHMEIGIFGDIKVKPPYERKNGELIWKSPPSPPEAVDPKFDMYHIPAIFLFLSNGQCIGKIDEKPQKTASLEGDILFYLKKA